MPQKGVTLIPVRKNFAEVLEESEPKTQAEVLLLAIGYLEDFEKIVPSRRAIDDLFHKFKRGTISNAGSVLRRMIGKGLVEETVGPDSTATYRMTSSGRIEFRRLTDTSLIKRRSIRDDAKELKNAVDKLSDLHEKGYLMEAINCYEVGAPRAAIVMTWCAVVRYLHRQMRPELESKFWEKYEKMQENSRFYQEKGQNPIKWYSGPGKLNDVKESDLIEVYSTIGLITKEERMDLRNNLELRNKCAHMSSYSLTPHEPIAFLEKSIKFLTIKK